MYLVKGSCCFNGICVQYLIIKRCLFYESITNITKLTLSKSDVPYATIRCITLATKVGRCSKQRVEHLSVSPTLENERRCTGCTLRRVVLDPEVNPHPAPCISRRIYPARLRTYQFWLNYSAFNPLLHCITWQKCTENFYPKR